MAFAQKESYIRRTFELAEKAYRHAGSNPCVGAVLVYKERIIGEGYYRQYGGPHAEVDCIHSVKEIDRFLIKKSTLYVSLEPCSIYGKTPPCANFIVDKSIPKVVISCLDPNPKICGNGVKILQQNNIEVEIGILQEEGERLIHKFQINVLRKRAFVALKWAQSKDGYAGKKDQAVWYTNEYSKIFAHKLRSRYEAILIGSNTVNIDNPRLNNRLFSVDKDVVDPIKIVIDRYEKCHKDSLIFHEGKDVIIFTYEKNYTNPNKAKCQIVFVDAEEDFWLFIFQELFKRDITSVLVEGGPTIQKAIIQANLWDEAHVLSSNSSQSSGIRAPSVTGRLIKRLSLVNDTYMKILPQKNS